MKVGLAQSSVQVRFNKLYSHTTIQLHKKVRTHKRRQAAAAIIVGYSTLLIFMSV